VTASNALKIAGIVVIVVIFVFISVGPAAGDFRALLSLVFNFVAAVAWPLAAVLIILILRKPLSDLMGRGLGQVDRTTYAPSQKAAETESKPD
jgi:hypothetical protein